MHPVMVRGIEKCEMVDDGGDCQAFVDRLGNTPAIAKALRRAE